MLTALAVVGLSGVAGASPVFLAGDSNIFTTSQDNEILFQNIFNGTSVLNASSVSLSGLGTTATETSIGLGAITSAELSGNDFLMFGLGRTSVTSAELAAITSFASSGGSLFLFGEGNPSFSSLNSAVNQILAAVGSTMSLSTSQNFDNGGFTNLAGISTETQYGAGVNSWTTAYASEILLGSGTAIISGTADNGFGVAVGGEGLSLAPVPLPAGGVLLLSALGLGGITARRRRRG